MVNASINKALSGAGIRTIIICFIQLAMQREMVMSKQMYVMSFVPINSKSSTEDLEENMAFF